MTVEKTPDRARREQRSMFRPQHLGQFDKGDVDLALDRRQDHVAIRFNPLGALVAALRLCPCRTALPPITYPAHGTCDRHAKSTGRCSPRQACLNSRDHPRASILGYRFHHARRPPYPANRMNQIFSALGIPRDSLRSDYALGFVHGDLILRR